MFGDGKTAIENALRRTYPGAPIRLHGFPDGHGTELLDFLEVTITDGHVPHRLFVSRGFTELDEKTEEDPDLSGWGFELTCRLPLEPTAGDVDWVACAMLDVSRFLADQITFLEPYNHLPLPTAPESSALQAAVIIDDVALMRTMSDNGRFSFFQLLGLTADELEAVNEWDAPSFVELVREKDLYLLTTPSRASLLSDAAFARRVNDGRERDGSSIGALYGVAVLYRVDQRDIELHLTTETVAIVRSAMRSRLAHGNPMYLFGDRRKSIRPDGSIAIRSQVNVAFHAENGLSAIERGDGTPTAVIRLSDAAIRQVAAILEPKPGTYVIPELGRVRFVVVTPERFREPSYP